MHFKLIMRPGRGRQDPASSRGAGGGGHGGDRDQQRPRRGGREARTFFGLSLTTQRDVLLFLVEEHLARRILERSPGRRVRDKRGAGIAFQIDVEDAVGVGHQAELLWWRKSYERAQHLRVRDVMKPQFDTVDGLARAEALQKMVHLENKCLIVPKRDEDDEIGIVLLSDIARLVLARDRSPLRVNVYEVMAKPVVPVSPDMDIRHCAKLFTRFDIPRAGGGGRARSSASSATPTW